MSDSGTGKKRGLDVNGGTETGNGPGQSVYTVCAIHFSKPLTHSFIVSEYLPHCHYVTNCIQGNFDDIKFLHVLKIN